MLNLRSLRRQIKLLRDITYGQIITFLLSNGVQSTLMEEALISTSRETETWTSIRNLKVHKYHLEMSYLDGFAKALLHLLMATLERHASIILVDRRIQKVSTLIHTWKQRVRIKTSMSRLDTERTTLLISIGIQTMLSTLISQEARVAII
jgi:hypothetical protein